MAKAESSAAAAKNTITANVNGVGGAITYDLPWYYPPPPPSKPQYQKINFLHPC